MSTPHEFFQFDQGVLKSEGVSLEKIAKEVGTPVYVYSSKAFLDPLAQLQEGLQGLDYLICFALKSNSNISVLKLLSEAGAGMDLVSGGELHRAGVAHVPAEKIVFSGVGKTTEEMSQALTYQNQGIFSFNVESTAELHALNEVAKKHGKKARVALRFNPDVDAKTHPYISTGLKKNKFGMQKTEVLQIIKNYSEFPFIEFKGISIHIGSQLLSLAPLQDAFSKLTELVEKINSHLPSPLSFVDLGGGVGITYRNEKAPSLQKYCALIQKFFGKKARLKYPLKVLVEPGRTISGNSGVLLSQVIFRKEQTQKDFLVIDAGMNDLIRPALYQSYHEIVPVKQALLNKKKRKTAIVGPVCESADCFAQDRELSSLLQSGDLVAILSSGAYGFAMASNYNSRPRPAEVLIKDGKYQIIRHRENYDDLIRGEVS